MTFSVFIARFRVPVNRSVLLVILIALGTLWGLSIPLTKLAVSTGHHPLGLLWWQFAISFVCLLPLVMARRSNVVVDGPHLVFFMVVAAIGTLVPNFLSFVTYAQLPGSIMALLIALVPLCALMVALVLRLERFSAIRLGGVLLGFMAVALIIVPDSALPDPSKVIWVFVGLLAPLCYGIEGNYLTLRQPADTGPIATLFAGSIIGLIILTPTVLWTGTGIDMTGSLGVAEWALVGSSIIHVVAYAGYIWIVGQTGPVFASLVGYVVTPAGMILSIVLLGEAPSPYIWLALGLILMAITLVRPSQSDQTG
ncbi:MAG: DMT family transporter [Pseudomonadota bacterium]